MVTDWRSTMMANAARDPYWQASVRREILDHPKLTAAIEDKCATCHMPMARYLAHVDRQAAADSVYARAAEVAARIDDLFEP